MVIFSQYRNDELDSLIDKLNTEYYSVLDNYCKNASGIVYELEQYEPHASMLLYMSLGTKFLEHVTDFVNSRIGILVPYIQELHEKKLGGHDCSECKTGCSVNHAMQLMGLKESQIRIKETLYRLQSVAMPLYSDTDYPDAYKSLRDQMTMIDTALTELFYLEEAHLIPKVKEAQKQIHVYNQAGG
jgi:hypothetical protein